MQRSYSFSSEDGVVLLHTDYIRIIIPGKAQSKVLNMLHIGHWGTTRIKQMARSYCWWPNMDAQIQQFSNQCSLCQQQNTASPAREFSYWPAAETPWQRLHLDFAGPFYNAMWLICVDAYSKYPFVTKMQSITAEATINALKIIFASGGLPDTIVTDNGRQFIAAAFQQLCAMQGIKHLTSALFHPVSNGEAEIFVRTFKQAFK